MSKRSSPRKNKKEEKEKDKAKVHRITRRHQEEVKMNHYAKRLDKIYTKLGMAKMVPQVVQKMRTEHADDPHEFYLKVCHKYGVTPEDKFDQYLLVYGKKTHEKFRPKEDKDKDKAAKDRDWEYEADEKSFKFDFTKNIKPDPRVVSQSPRRAKQVERMYQLPKRRKKPIQSVAQQRRSSPRGEYKTNYNERRSPSTSPRLTPRSRKIEYVHIYVGDICETMVLTNSNKNQETGFWIQARVLAINTKKETMDLQVLQPEKYGLSGLAKDVPNRYVRSPAQGW